MVLRSVAICVAWCVFLSTVPGIEEVHALAPRPGVLNPAVKSEGWIMELEKSGRLVYSDHPEEKDLYRRIMEDRGWPEAILMPDDGRILVSEKIKQNRIKIIRAVIHEEIEALMQLMAHNDDPDEAKRNRERERYEKIKKVRLKG